MKPCSEIFEPSPPAKEGVLNRRQSHMSKCRIKVRAKRQKRTKSPALVWHTQDGRFIVYWIPSECSVYAELESIHNRHNFSISSKNIIFLFLGVKQMQHSQTLPLSLTFTRQLLISLRPLLTVFGTNHAGICYCSAMFSILGKRSTRES